MKKFLILLITCLLGIEVFASDWYQLSSKTYILIEKNKDNQFFIWEKRLNKGDVKPIKGEKVYYDMAHMVVDCSNNTSAIIDGYTYGLNGNVLDSFHAPYYEFNSIVPQSVGEGIRKYVCGY